MGSRNVPEVRVAGFSGEWESRKLSSIKDVRDGTHDSPKYYTEGFPLITSKNLTGSGLEMSDISFISEQDFKKINNRSKVDVGDIIFGMIGTIGNPVLIERDDFAIKNVALIKSGGKATNEFLIQLLKSSIFRKYIKNENAGNTQKFLGLGKIRNFLLHIPSYQEQIKIGSFFKQLDDTINLHQQELNTLKETKQGFLQKMFPKEGETVPEVRFAGFSGEWEECELGNIVDFFSGLTYSPENILPERGTLVLRSSNVKNGEIINADNVYVVPDIVNSDNVMVGDIIVVVRNGSRNLIGKHAQVKKQMENTVIGAFMTGIRSEVPSFTNALLDTMQFNIEINKNLGATINQITMGSFKKMKFIIPLDRNEREKIGKFFKQLDEKITLQQRELDLLIEAKKAFLQKMFI